MKRLSFSLLFVVLASAVGLGWSIDRYFVQISQQAHDQSASPELLAYHQLGNNLAATLDKQVQAERFVEDWNADKGLTLSLVALSKMTLPDTLITTFTSGAPLELESEKHIMIHFFLPKKQQVLVLSVLKPKNDESIKPLRLLLTSIFYGGILLVVILWLYPLSQQLRRLREYTQALGQGQLDKRIKLSSTSYIVDIEKEFNNMAQRIKTLIEDNKLLGNAVSHDLRTPLARLRFGIEALQQTTHPDSREKYQQRISDDIAEMEKLVTVLLNYARLEQHFVTLSKQDVDLSKLLIDCIGLQNMHPNGRAKINWQPGAAIWVRGDPDYLSMMINNILDNAQQYAQQVINVTLTQTSKAVSLCVADDGCGIPDNQRDIIINPFTRGPQQSEQTGYGMGLAIVARVADWHDASLTVDDSAELHGAEFTLRFSKN